MAKSGPLVVDQLIDKPTGDIMKALDKKKFVIKNAHSKEEMNAVEQEFAEHKGSFLTLQQALELAKAAQAPSNQEKAT